MRSVILSLWLIFFSSVPVQGSMLTLTGFDIGFQNSMFWIPVTNNLFSRSSSLCKGLACSFERPRNKENANASDKEHQKRPFRHLLLGLQVVCSLGMMVVGFRRLRYADSLACSVAAFRARTYGIFFFGFGGSMALIGVILGIK
jgi:hypothetical protein